MIKAALYLVEKGFVPDIIIRKGIRGLVKARIKQETETSHIDQNVRFQKMVAELKDSPVALVPEKANEQHYEVPPGFFKLALGKHLKYSCCYYPDDNSTLDEAEKAMLELTCDRAELHDNMEILELGCGWGSLTLYMAEHFPKSRITAVSNSKDQRKFILSRAEEKGIENIEVVTCDMNDFTTTKKFDRIVSIEMFEHMRNYKILFNRVLNWLKPDGMLFVHIFCHNTFVYPFEARNDTDWMAKYFFTGGLMPAYSLFEHFQDDLIIKKQWKVNGIHYKKTAFHWLKNMEYRKTEIMKLFAEFYGKSDARLWFVRWRLFFMACGDLFGYNNGTEWFVGHYLFTQKNISEE
ncbi:SAM-dependent methyltransferase [candidate division KSB1 bacterium]